MRERSRESCQRTCDEIHSSSVRKHSAHAIAFAESPLFAYAETPEAGFLVRAQARRLGRCRDATADRNVLDFDGIRIE